MVIIIIIIIIIIRMMMMENASELERLLDVKIDGREDGWSLHEWRTVRDRSGARLEEEDEEEDKLAGDGGGKEGKLYFDILLSFLGTSGDESLLLRKMWTRVNSSREKARRIFERRLWRRRREKEEQESDDDYGEGRGRVDVSTVPVSVLKDESESYDLRENFRRQRVFDCRRWYRCERNEQLSSVKNAR